MKNIFVSYIIFSFIFINCAFALEDELVKYIKNAQKPAQNTNIIEDNLAKNLKNTEKIKTNANATIEDDLIKYLNNNELKKPSVNLSYAYEDSLNKKLYLSPLNFISTKDKTLKEGNIVYFINNKDIKYKDKLIKKGEKIKARIETISLNEIYGVPSNLKIGNFEYQDMILNGEINLTGANRTIWVYPTIYLTIGFFGAGLLLIPVRGGHAKLKPSKNYIINVD